VAPATAHWVVYCDGSAVPNPGRMGLGALLVAPDGVTQHPISEATTFTGCNNEAELRALLRALQMLGQHVLAAATTVQVYSDSSVLVEQLGARAVAPIERLAPLFDEARNALQQFAQVDLQWIPRHRNGTADGRARAALGLAPKAATPPCRKNKRR
jgi:ribonuclease HI